MKKQYKMIRNFHFYTIDVMTAPGITYRNISL
jgi:hypothetical protein